MRRRALPPPKVVARGAGECYKARGESSWQLCRAKVEVQEMEKRAGNHERRLAEAGARRRGLSCRRACGAAVAGLGEDMRETTARVDVLVEDDVMKREAE